ncbi:peptidoglycan editing factor PgeF [Xylophilus sp. ASV27]|uniref:peptidoglycan editing factor PgeF n=1 Tax=Xylophilus sp. ASV27 TaxID=2795129 RepID=UPI0018EDCB4F|nr:peptidoglycan editing factor PgeF [Xylophilus sp. ASV27]
MHPDWIVPDWPAPAGVRALCTTRAGGVSDGPWASLNLGDHVGDAPAAVQANRARLAQATVAQPVFLRQVHGSGVLSLDDPAVTHGATADACVATAPGRACTIMVADCLPVLLTERAGRAVGAAHAGWRGLAGGVLEALCERFRAEAQEESGLYAIELIAWLGPCIGPDAFEVGSEVRAAFVARDAGAADCFRPAAVAGHWWADLPALARRRLAAAGVASVHGNDGSAAWCTVGNASRFFSHRRDALRLGSSGRMAACVWRV